MGDEKQSRLATLRKGIIGFATRNTGTKLLAVLLSMLLWVTITQSSDPPRTKRFTIPADRVELRGQETLSERGLTLLRNEIAELLPAGLDVRVSAANSRYKYLREENVSVYLDLSRLSTTGNHTVLVGVEIPTYATLVSLSPDNVSVQLDEAGSVWVPLTLEITGELPEGLWMDEPLLGQSRVAISGPKQTVSEVTGAKISLDLSSLSSSIDTMRPVTLINDGGLPVEADALNFDGAVSLQVTVLPVKSVPIDISGAMLGEPARGYVSFLSSISDFMAVVAAPQDVLDDLETVRMEPILIDGRTESFIETLKLVLPDGAVHITPETATLSISISEEQERLDFPATKVRFAGLEDGLSAECAPDSVDISITGAVSLTARLKASDIKLYADLSNLGPGEHVVELLVDLEEAHKYDIQPAVRRVIVTIEQE